MFFYFLLKLALYNTQTGSKIANNLKNFFFTYNDI